MTLKGMLACKAAHLSHVAGIASDGMEYLQKLKNTDSSIENISVRRTNTSRHWRLLLDDGTGIFFLSDIEGEI
jgi:hypothetical protein